MEHYDTNFITLFIHMLASKKTSADHFSVYRLDEEYPKWFEKPVLEMIHHNTVSLDKLVEMAWLEILTKYALDEECDFLVSFTSKMLLFKLAFGFRYTLSLYKGTWKLF